MFAQLAQLGFSVGGALLGSKSARKSAQSASNAADAIGSGYGHANTERRAGMERAIGYLSPYEETGRGGQNLLADALGINGPEAQRSYFANFNDDPGFSAVQDAGIGAVEQSRSVSGGLKSGATMKALMDYGQRLKQTVFQDRLNRLESVGKTGATAATNMATLADSGSKDIAGYHIGAGQARAGGIIGASNAEAAGTQNLISMLGYGAGAIGGMGNDLMGKFKMGGSLGNSSMGNPTQLGAFY